MPRITAARLDESCLDSAVVKSFELDGALDEATMYRLASNAKLQYFPDFPRPYFRIDRARAYVVQGIVGDRQLRVTFSPLATETTEGELRSLIENGGGVGPLGWRDQRWPT